MAIVNCPECNEKISTNSKSCVHCGCNLSFCKECGAVFVGEVDVCSECGFQMTENKKESLPKETGLAAVNKTFDEWSAESNSKIYDIVLICLKILSWGLFLGALIRFVTFPKVDLMEYKSAEELLVALLVMYVIVSVIHHALAQWRDLSESTHMCAWAKRKNIDLKQIILCYLQDDFGERANDELNTTTESVQRIINAKMLEDPVEKSKEPTSRILKILFKCGASIFTYAFVITNVKKVWLPATLLTGKNFWELMGEFWDFSAFGSWWLLVVGVGFFLVRCIYSYIDGKNAEGKMDRWFNKNFDSEYYNKYRKYIRNEEHIWGE